MRSHSITTKNLLAEHKWTPTRLAARERSEAVFVSMLFARININFLQICLFLKSVVK